MSRALRLGVFIVASLAILAAGIFLIGNKQFLFSSTYPLRATFENVAGLNGGADVRVGGIHRGTVTSIQLPARPGEGMTVVMKMESSTRRVIRQDSVASIQTEGLLGSKYVEVSFGSPNAQNVDDGARIASVPPVDISDVVKKANYMLDTAQKTMTDVQETASHFREISDKIDSGSGTIGALVNDKKLYAQLSEATDKAKLGATAFQENMLALKHNFFLRGFFNKRGYEDSTRLAQHAITERPAGPYVKTFHYDVTKIFAGVDNAKLKGERNLNDAGHFLEQTPFGMAVVLVSSGMKGDAAQLQVLMQARAMVVRDYLVNNFRMNDRRVKTMTVGKSDESSTDYGMVDILIVPATATRRPPTNTRVSK